MIKIIIFNIFNKRPRCRVHARIRDFACGDQLTQLDRNKTAEGEHEAFLRCRASLYKTNLLNITSPS